MEIVPQGLLSFVLELFKMDKTSIEVRATRIAIASVFVVGSIALNLYIAVAVWRYIFG